jgi:hypothetical protein
MQEWWAVDVVMIVFVEEGRNLRKELGLLRIFFADSVAHDASR